MWTAVLLLAARAWNGQPAVDWCNCEERQSPEDEGNGVCTPDFFGRALYIHGIDSNKDRVYDSRDTYAYDKQFTGIRKHPFDILQHNGSNITMSTDHIHTRPSGAKHHESTNHTWLGVQTNST